MGNTFGRFFRVTTFGESHGQAVGCVIDGCPPNIELPLDAVAAQLARRRPGGPAASQRKEADEPEILSGVFEGRTLGTPIAIIVRNTNQRSADYDDLRQVYRPSHADYTYDLRYGIRDHRGGGRASARETVGRVAAGAVAEQVIRALSQADIVAYVTACGTITLPHVPDDLNRALVDQSPVRCPDPAVAAQMLAAVESARAAGDSLGGVVECRLRNVPGGLGSPVFHKFEADLAAAMLSLPASKGFEIGSGFGGATMRGSEHNDRFVNTDGRIQTETNRSGGIQGGITNGADVVFRVAFKPPASIALPQSTVDAAGAPVELSVRGRHDPFTAARAVPIVEAMAALVLVDQLLELATIRTGGIHSNTV